MKLLAPKLFYFYWFVALGVYSPFVVLYYRRVGLDEAQIGLLRRNGSGLDGHGGGSL